MVDDVFGDVSASCVPALPASLLPGESITCTFTEFLSGDAGQVHTNVSTASGEDDDGNPVEDDDDETVPFEDVLPDITVTKTADPTSIPETGGNVTFTFLVTNNGLEDVTLDSLVDTEFGDLNGQGDCSVPQALAGSGGTYSCAFTVFLSGNASGAAHNNVVTATASDDDGNTDEDTDDETVTFEDVLPDISVLKTADPTSVPETGGNVTFTFLVTNNGLEDVTLDSLVDTDFGNLNGQGDCSVPQALAASGDTYSCAITVFLSGNASGAAHNNVVTATASDDDGNTDEDTDDETVTFEDVLPDISVLKTAVPTSIPETGGDVTFTFLVTNIGPEDVTLESLVDTDFIDLNGQGDCSVPQALAGNGGTYSCSITVFLSGDFSGKDHYNEVTATAFDDERNSDVATDDATVTYTDVLPKISVLKTADPTSVPETGGNVEFTFLVTNHSAEGATLDSLVDSDFGDLHNQGTCAVPQTLAGYAGTYTCSITVFISGDASGPAHNNVVTAKASDNEGNIAEDTDDETVTFDDVLPDVTITKTADPTAVLEPGGNVEFTIVVTNNSLEDATIDSLVDSDFDLAANCVDAVGTVLASGASYTCTFTEFIAGNVGEDHQNTATVVASDDDGNSDTKSDDAAVTVNDVQPAITTVKTANPTNVPEPGADVTFTVEVTNDSVSSDPVIIDSLTDDVHGDLNGQGDCIVPQTIQPGDSYTCSFTALVEGNAGYSETDVVTASGSDDEGNPVSDDDDATVTVDDVQPAISTVKTANPTNVPEPGADVTFTVEVTNDSVSADPATISSLTDDIHGDLNGQGDCSVPQTIQPGDTYSCSFTAFVAGNAGDSETDIVTASGTDDEGNSVSDSDDATVTVDDVQPAISTVKTANPTNVPEPGADVTFTVEVTNDLVSADPVTISSLTDDIHGDLNGQGDCSVPQTIQPGDTYSCSFTAFVAGNAGDSETDIVTASGTDDEGNSVSDSDDATVTVNDVQPAISTVKTANPTNVPEPGADVTFTVEVTNDSVSADPVIIDSLTDDVHGDLNGQGDCIVPQTIQPGDSYTCSFTALVEGNAGYSETDVVTASGSDDEGNPVSDDDDATVTVDDVDPDIAVTKRPIRSRYLPPARR